MSVVAGWFRRFGRKPPPAAAAGDVVDFVSGAVAGGVFLHCSAS